MSEEITLDVVRSYTAFTPKFLWDLDAFMKDFKDLKLEIQNQILFYLI